MPASSALDRTESEPRPPRRHYPISLRIFIVMLILLGAAAAWIGIKGYRQTLIVRQIKAARGFVTYRGQTDADGRILNTGQPRGAAWVRKVIGDDFFDEPVAVHFNYTEGNGYREGGRTIPVAANGIMNDVVKLPQLKSLSISGIRLTPQDLARISDLKKLESLSLGERTLGDHDLDSLKDLPLKWLALHRTQVSDRGLQSLGDMKSLRYLDLTRTRVTDKGLRHLEGLQNLRTLIVLRSKVTLEGARRLKEKLPDCEIHWQSLESGRMSAQTLK